MIPGGNDSYGAGLSAGGAQVIGQSQGINDLVKLGMARQKQKQAKLWNAPMPTIDTSKIKDADSAKIFDFVNKFKDESIAGNNAPSVEERYQHELASNNFYAQAMDLVRRSQNGQESLMNARKVLEDPNNQVAPESYAKAKLAVENFGKTETGSPEEAAALEGLNLRRYQKWDQAGLDKAINGMAQTQTSQGSWNPIQPHERQQTTYTSRTADRGATIGEIQRQVESNEIGKQLYTTRGQDIINNPGNKDYLHNLASQYNIDPTNPLQVAYAQHADQAYNNMGKYSVTSNKLDKDPSHLSITVGPQGQPAALPDQAAPEYIKARQGTGQGAKKGILQTLSYDHNDSGITPFTGTTNGTIYNPAKNAWMTVPGINDARTSGGSTQMSFWKPGVTLKQVDSASRKPLLDDNGKEIWKPANEGAVSDHTIEQAKSNPALAGRIQQKEVYHVTGTHPVTGKKIEAFIPKASIGQAGFKTTGKGIGAAVGKEAANALRATNAADNAHVDIKDGKKIIKGF